MEWIDGRSVRALLGGGADEDVELDALEHADAAQDGVAEMGLDAFGATDGAFLICRRRAGRLSASSWTADEVMAMIGAQLAAMHAATIIHGDLTTSNMMVRPAPARTLPCEIVRL
jgi:TP53 regulating kinase-like protein